ncbi:MAG: LysR family transcriptional regulator [Acidobacteriota bacterium]
MEIRHLECFKVLAEELHFGRAARRLFIAQPPLSRQIKKLEAELGVTLFDRTNRYVKLTPFGKYFRTEVLRLFARMDMIKAHLALMKEGAAGELRIGFVGTVMHTFLPGLLAEFRIRQPNINTTLLELNNIGQVAALRGGTLDVGFLRSPLAVPDLTVRLLFKESFSLILPPGHSLAGAKNVSLEKLAREPFVGFDKGCGNQMSEIISGICRAAGFTPKTVQMGQIDCIIRLVEAGVGWSIVPSSACRAYKARVRVCELDERPERAEICIAYNDVRHSPAKDLFLSMVDSTNITPSDHAGGGRDFVS